MGERFAVVSEEDINLLVEKAVPENTKKSTSYTHAHTSKLTVFLELRSRKTIRFSEQIMSVDKYPYIFSRQMKTIVYVCVYQHCNGGRGMGDATLGQGIL